MTQEKAEEYFTMLREEIPDFSRAEAMSYCAGRENMFFQLLKKYVTPDRKAELEELFAARRWEEYTDLIHRMKGMARTLGFLEFGNRAELLQKAAERREEETLLLEHPKAMELLAKILACAERITES